MKAQRGHETEVGEIFEAKDTNGDGQLSIEEFCAVEK
jgi:Ca2+-binding EF-hand superfamily protein